MSSKVMNIVVKSGVALSILFHFFVVSAQAETSNVETKKFELRPRHVYFYGDQGQPSEFAKKAGDRLCEMRGFERAVKWTDARMATSDIENPRRLTGFQTFQKNGKAFVKLTSFEEIMKDAKVSEEQIAVLFKSVTCERPKGKTATAAVESELFQDDPADIDLESLRPRLSEQSIEEL